MSAWDEIKTVEDLFEDMENNKYSYMAKPLATYLKELMREGFTRREAMRLVEAHQHHQYNLMMEEFISGNEADEDYEEEHEHTGLDDDDDESYA